MFNLITKERKQHKEIALIEEIHGEFDSAQERLLDEAKLILSTSNNDNIVSISDRLKTVGFVNTPTAKKGEAIKKVLVESEQQAELISYYTKNYPLLKFLTESELDRICTKYGLVYAPISNYLKEVPEKNLRDIELAQRLKPQDEPEPIRTIRINKFWDGNTKLKWWLRNRVIPYKYDVESETHIKNAIIDMGYTGSFGSYIYRDATVETTHKSGLFIAAPKSHFDTTNLIESGIGFFSITKIEIKDPIVFRYVNGGIQVLTKWGLEAEDPALVVPNLN